MLSRGSEWRRWEPHIHAPGTVMNNQFSGPDSWNDYLTALERAIPVIEAIAVTDYYVTDTYEEVLRHKAAGRLPATKLIFPNVELRLDVATTKGGFVNLHLFVSPEDPQHVEELQRLFSRLQFNVMQDRFDCTQADLIRLGKKADPTITTTEPRWRLGPISSKSTSKSCAKCCPRAVGRKRTSWLLWRAARPTASRGYGRLRIRRSGARSKASPK
jgi:hypothetical protein